MIIFRPFDRSHNQPGDETNQGDKNDQRNIGSTYDFHFTPPVIDVLRYVIVPE